MSFDAKEEIKNKLDVVEVISSYIQLQKAGTNYKACCPFHNEKTPSFMVSPQRQMWRCFGCNKSGDIFTFIMDFENVDFFTALKILADKAGVVLPKFDKEEFSQDKASYEIMDFSVKYFQNNLFKNQEVLKYLSSRGLNEETLKEFKIGFALDEWRDLFVNLVKQGFKAKDIFETGLIIQKNDTLNNSNVFLNNNNFYDRFRSRIMFPIHNNSSQVVGYTGRIFEGKASLKTIKNIDETGKYINSPQTKIYEKSKILYGYNITKRHINSQNEAIVVEGTTDFLSGYIKGHKNIVASLGTALTTDQLNLLKRMTNNLILAYDNDEAGKIATERNIKLGLAMDFNLKILDLKSAKDLSDFINQKDNDLSLEIKNALPVMDFYIKRGKALFNINILEGKREFLNYFFKKLKWEKDIIKISHYLNEISFLLDIKLEVLDETFHQTKAEPLEDNLAYHQSKKESKNHNLVVKNRHENISETILAVFTQFPVMLKAHVSENKKFFYQKFQKFLELIDEKGVEIIHNNLINSETKEIIDFLYMIGSQAEIINQGEEKIIKEIESLLAVLKEEYYKRQINLLKNKIKNAEAINDNKQLGELLLELSHVCEALNQINKQ